MIPVRTTRVHITREALLEMALAAIEPFKKECLGAILGCVPTERHNRFLVASAIPFQIVKERRNDSVVMGNSSFKRITDVLLELPSRHCCLGFFHTHTEWGPCRRPSRLSEGDIEDALQNESKLEVLVRISSRYKGRVLWENQDNGSIRGSMNGYNIEFHAYVVVPKKHPKKEKDYKTLRLKIVAPSALKFFNRLQKPH